MAISGRRTQRVCHEVPSAPSTFVLSGGASRDHRAAGGRFARATLRAPSPDRVDGPRSGRHHRRCRDPPTRRATRRPARPRAAARAAAARDRARVEGPAAAVGPPVPPDVLVPRELPGRPGPRLHRPLLAPGRRRPRSVLRPRHDAAPGLRGGPDRRRQRPQPLRPPADRGQGRAARPAPRPRPASPALRLAWNAGSAGWLALGERVWRRSRRAATPLVPVAGSGDGPDDGAEPVPVEVALAFHPRTLGQLLFVRTTLRLDDRTDRFLAAALTGILHGKSASYLSELMPNTFSMAPRYVRDFAARTAFASPERDVFDGLAKKLDRLYPPAAAVRPRASRCSATRATWRRGPARPLRARGRPERARLVVTSPPYLRVVKYGYYNWLRTWFLGFDARAIDATLDDAHHREPYLVFLRDVLAGLRPVLADDAVVVLVIGDVETDRGRRIRGGVGLAERVWEAAPSPRATGWPASRSTTSRPPQDDQALGRRGRPGDQDGPDPRPRRDRGRPPARARGRRHRRRLDLAAEGSPRPLECRHAADVPPVGPGRDGSAGPDEEPRPRPDDQPAAVATSSSSRSTCTRPRRTSCASRSTATSRRSARSRARWRGAASAPEASTRLAGNPNPAGATGVRDRLRDQETLRPRRAPG